MKITPLVASLWMLNVALHCILCFVIVRRKLYEEMPVFSYYTIASTVWQVVIAICLFAISFSAYFYAFWIFEALSILCDCWVLIELYRRVLKDRPRVKTIGMIVLRYSFVLLLMTGYSLMALRPAPEHDFLMGFLLVLSRSVKVMQLGLVVVVFGFVGYFRIPLRRAQLGVAVGIGIIAAVNMAVFATSASYGSSVIPFVNPVLMSGYAIAALCWIWFLSRSEPELSAEEAPKPDDLKRWNDAMMDLMNR